MLDEILDSADRPLNGRGWWMQEDDPWQVLACCVEIAAALKSPDHRQFVSHFPVHQDGSCNGLQHYAAMGRDQLGADCVNLTPREIPQVKLSQSTALIDLECLEQPFPTSFAKGTPSKILEITKNIYFPMQSIFEAEKQFNLGNTFRAGIKEVKILMIDTTRKMLIFLIA